MWTLSLLADVILNNVNINASEPAVSVWDYMFLNYIWNGLQLVLSNTYFSMNLQKNLHGTNQMMIGNELRWGRYVQSVL